MAGAFFRIDRGGQAAIASLIERPYMTETKSRVIRVYDPDAGFWDYRSEEYLDFISQPVVDAMVERGVVALTGESDVAGAWKRLIPNYGAGERVAIKPNFNALHLGPHGLITCPQLIRAVVKGLVESLHVRETDIYVYDLCKLIPEERIRDRIGYRINYVERRGDGMFDHYVVPRLGLGLESPDRSAMVATSASLTDSAGDDVKCFMPKVVTQCEHLINIALLSNHPFLAITGPLKNHFGTVRFSNYNSYPVVLHGKALKPSLVDINMNPNIREKTRLVLCDALFGQFGRGDNDFNEKWRTFPSENGVPNSVFVATDPVALESLLVYFVNREREARELQIRSHDYLHLAEQKGLGIHEDFENVEDLQRIDYRTV